MKRILLLLAIVALPTTLFAQGQVVFANTATTLFTTNYAGQTGPMSGANAFRIGLWIAPDGTVDESLFTLVAVATNLAAVPGRFTHSETPFTISGNTGTPIAFQVRAWLAANPFFSGKSPIGRVTPEVGVAPPPGLFGPGDYPGQLTSGVVIVAPEPSTWALGALGALIGLCSRKRFRSG